MNSSKNPLVTVVIPAFNAEFYISEAIESVFSQTYQNYEVIVIDDGSSDSTLQIVEEYCIKYENVKLLTHPEHQNRGVSKSRQLGVQQAQGKYIAFLDADDFWEPQKIGIQVALLEISLFSSFLWYWRLFWCSAMKSGFF